MKIVTAQQMKNIDRRAIRGFGIPGPVLMENAAAAIMAEMEKFFDGLANVRVGIICGKGNNGGDGLALARRLSIRGVPVRVALLAPFSAVAVKRRSIFPFSAGWMWRSSRMRLQKRSRTSCHGRTSWWTPCSASGFPLPSKASMLRP
jgi:hydroxyethylthiazole kinase-like uncharacterized protein yjeF